MRLIVYITNHQKYCPACNGFGIQMDGRWRPFKLRGLKKRLIEHKIDPHKEII